MRRIAPDGTVSTVARLPGALSVALDAACRIYVAEVETNRVYRLTSEGRQQVGPTFVDPSDLAVAADGTVFVVEHDARRVRAVTPSGAVRTIAG